MPPRRAGVLSVRVYLSPFASMHWADFWGSASLSLMASTTSHTIERLIVGGSSSRRIAALSTA